MFERVLIANRGEIAVRITRTLREMGIRSVVVASIPDRHGYATRVADETVLLEGYSAAETYLDMDAIIAAAKSTGCQAIHPGYGFLSERADFAERCAAEGITFVGPPPAELRALGDKSSARRLAVGAGVPVVPGWDGDDDPATLAREAARIGYPVMVKARGGGGGRGMRVVAAPGDLADAVESARREAQSAFGDGGLLLEKLVTEAHHVEVQVFGDTHGNLVHLGERDCSVQRRRQKLVEESPSPVVDDELRARLTDAALRIARAVDYVNAGTVEFLVSQPATTGQREFYFLEVNPRLQVEHPVTEMVTGLDLVSWQLRVAAGEPLPLTQNEIRFEGHAIEFRINAEDPREGFQPATGRLTWVSDDERWDAGYEPADEVPAQYDSLIGKRVFHESTREAAIDCAVAVTDADDFAGIATNAGLVRALADSAEFRAGSATVDWLEARLEALLQASRTPPQVWVAAGLGYELLYGGSWMAPGARSRWFSDGQESVEVALERIGAGRYRAAARGSSFECRAELRHQWGLMVQVQVGGESHSVAPGHATDIGGSDLYTSRGFWLVRPPPMPRRAHAPADGVLTLLAPLSGTIAAVSVDEGTEVEEGQLLAVLEAMKMEHRLVAPSGGRVTSIRVRPGDVVREGDLLVELA